MTPHSDDLPPRLALAIASLLEQFKVGPEGTAYDGLSLTDTAIVSRIAMLRDTGQEIIQKDIGAALGLPKTTMTSAIKRLETAGLVHRESGSDARTRLLGLSEAGLDLARHLRDAQVSSSARMLACLPSEDQQRLVALLEQINEKVTAGSRD